MDPKCLVTAVSIRGNTVFKSESVEELHWHINRIHPSIQFTAELESEGAFLLLDTWVKWMEDGNPNISVYRKPTHTDRYFHFKSHHPAHVKQGLLRCLFNRAKAVTLSYSNLSK